MIVNKILLLDYDRIRDKALVYILKHHYAKNKIEVKIVGQL